MKKRWIFAFVTLISLVGCSSSNDSSRNTVAVNREPTTADISINTKEDVEISFGSKFKEAYKDEDSDTLVYITLIDYPKYGDLITGNKKVDIDSNLTQNDINAMRYVPNSNYFGSDGFNFKAYDGKSYSNEAKVNITIESVVDHLKLSNNLYFHPRLTTKHHTVTKSTKNITATVTADMDKDGYIDILSVSSRYPDRIIYFKNSGNGNFLNEKNITTQANVSVIYAADIDGDKDMDIITGNKGESDIWIYKNNDSGNFSSEKIEKNNNKTNALYVADMDDDSKVDIIAAIDDEKVVYYSNKGNDLFSDQKLIAEIDNPTALIARDIDGDKFVDVIVASKQTKSAISICKSNNDNNFTTTQQKTSYKKAKGIAVADMNNDGVLDIVASLTDGDSTQMNQVAWYQNNGNVGDYTEHLLGATFALESIALGDLNDDDKTDIIAATSQLPQKDDVSRVFWYPNINGTFSKTHNISTDSNSSGSEVVLVSDFNNDKKTDVLTVFNNQESIKWYENANVVTQPENTKTAFSVTPYENATFTLYGDKNNLSETNSSKNGVSIGKAIVFETATDFENLINSDKNNIYDITLKYTDAPAYGSEKIYVVIEDQSYFKPSIVSNSFKSVSDVASDDIDGDGDLDIIAVSSDLNKLAWFGLNTDGNYTQTDISTELTDVSRVTTGDVDEDGHYDIVVAYKNTIAWYKNNNGVFDSKSTIIDRDANQTSSFYTKREQYNEGEVYHIEWIAAAQKDSIVLYQKKIIKNVASFERKIIDNNVSDASSVYGADMNDDKKYDIIASYKNTIAWYDSENNYTKTIVSTLDGVCGVATRDIDDDGKTDVIAISKDKLVFYKNNGKSFEPSTNIDTGLKNPSRILFVDIDKDKKRDIAVTMQDSDNLVWYKNNGDTTFTRYIVSHDLDGASSVDTGHFIDAGLIDIVTASKNSGTITLFEHTEDENNRVVGQP